jgi:hypothetical protein
VSVGIELVQFALLLTCTSRRSVDVDDVILNVRGACHRADLSAASGRSRRSAVGATEPSQCRPLE